jgi:hypothetical protein
MAATSSTAFDHQLTNESETTSGRLRQRKWIAGLLVVVSSFFALVALIAVWAHQTIFDTDAFMETIEPVLQDPAVNAALGDYITEEATGALALEERLQEPLADLDAFLSTALLGFLGLGEQAQELLDRFDRPTLQALAGPIADRVNERIATRVDEVMASSEVRVLVPQLVRRAHEGAVALARGEMESLPNVSVEEGEVRFNTLPIIARVLQAMAAELRGLLPDVDLPDALSDRADEAIAQFKEALGDRVPDDFGQITIMSEDQLVEIQDTATTLDRWTWGLAILAAVLVVITILVSPTRRRTVIQLGIGVIIAIILGVLIVRRVETAVIGEISSPARTETARGILENLFAGLRQTIVGVIVVAALVAIGFHIAGKPKWVTDPRERLDDLVPNQAGARAFDSWVALNYDFIRIGLAGLALIVLFMTGLGWAPLIIVGGILAAALWWLARVRDRATSPPAEQEPMVDSAPGV